MNNNFGEKILKLRKEKNWTQEEMAAKLNVSAQAVSKWETNVSYPDITLLPKIAEIFNTSIDDLLGNKKPVVEVVPPQNRKDISKLLLRINIISEGGDKVKVNLPLSIVRIALHSGVTPNINGKDVLKDIDFEQILSLVEQGVVGKLVEITSSSGDIVEIYVE